MDIAAWLAGLRLEQYRQAFEDNDVDGALLPGLTGDDLKEIGVASLGHRKKLLDAIAALNSAPGIAAATPVPPRPDAARQHDAERRHLSVMFVDLVGSTALSGRLDPEEMRDVLRSYQNTVAGEIGRFDGFTAKLMGDGVLAYFGWPRTHEDEAERAVRAGLAVIAAVRGLPMAAGEPLAARVGIATGLVVVGDLVGEGAAQEQAVVGDTPNLAARLQAGAEPGMVVIAESTRRLLGDLFEIRDLGMQTLKGIGEPVPSFAVLGERALESRFAARRVGGLAPIVGRDQELGQLLERWSQAAGGEGQAILLTGEAGIGKSRISEALIEATAGEPHFLIRYQCSPYHADSALYPVVQQLSHAARFAADDNLEQRLEKLEALLAQAGDGSPAAPLLAALLGLDGTARYGALTLTPQQRRSRTLAALIGQLTGLAAKKPVLWLVEDAHWVDPTTLELIEQSLDRVQTSRVLLLITARPTLVAGFASHPVVTRLALNRLARVATQAIVARITHGKHLPEALLDEIAAKTDGVPLFVEEMTKAVIESGAMRETEDAYLLDGPLSALAVPATLHDSLMARLDRLHGVKEVAQTAAVIGRSFDHATIAALAGLPERALGEALQRLLDAELVFRRGAPPDATYLFKHALVRDAAYESLLKARRVALHARLLDILEADDGTAPEIKAQHAEAAGLNARALDLWEQAGVLALARPAYKEAIASFESGIRVCAALGDDPKWKRREQGLHIQIGQALIANQGYQAPAALRAFERAMVLADELADVALQLPAAYGLWVAPYIGGRDTSALADRYVALAEAQPETGPRVVGLRILGMERFHAGRFKESLALMQRGCAEHDPVAHRDLARRYGHDSRAASTSYQAWNLWLLGFPDQAARRIEDSLRVAREVNHANTTGLVLCYGTGLPRMWARLPDLVEGSAREALRLAEDNAMALWHATALIQLGWALSQQGKAPGLDEIDTGLRALRQMGAGRMEMFIVGIAAEAYARNGRHEEAWATLDRASGVFAGTRDQALAADLHRVRAGLALRAPVKDRAAAEADLRRALEIARGQEALSLELRAAHDLAAVLAECGERRQAVDLLAPVYGRFTEGFTTPDLTDARALLDALTA